jgi:amidase
MTDPTWRTQGEAKRQAILNAIPEKWQLQDPVPPATELRDVTGYIRQYLTDREIEITETDAVDITAQTTTGNWSAVEVTEAFCHRAALAHQLVRSNEYSPVIHINPITNNMHMLTSITI